MNIKLLIAAHKPYSMPAGEAYLPIHVGAARSTQVIPGFQRDDTGDNISTLNSNWCELTALYWAWKNLQCDYLGLAHYRRLFKGRHGALTDDELKALTAKYDIILPKKRNYFIESSYSHYAHAHHANDLDETRRIIATDYPDYFDAFDSVMRRTSSHRFNMFIMRRALADEYCAWLFDILQKLAKRLDIRNYTPYDARVFGFVGERLLDVWLLRKGLKYHEIPVLNLESQHWPRKALNFLIRKFLPKKYHPAR